MQVAQGASSWLLRNWSNNCLFPYRNYSVLVLKSTPFFKRIDGYSDVYTSKAGVALVLLGLGASKEKKMPEVLGLR